MKETLSSSHASVMRVADGFNIVVEKAGSESAPIVVLLHGGGQTRRSWSRTTSALVSEGYAVISFDARGHGESDWAPDGDYSLAAYARDLQSLLSGYDASRTILVGASIGAATALLHTSGERPPPAALVLVDMVLQPAPGSGRRLINFMTGNPNGFATLADAAAAVNAFNPARDKVTDIFRLLPNLRLGDDHRYRWHWDPRLFGDPEQPSLPEFGWLAGLVSGRIRSPTLLIRGDQSEVVDDAGVEHLGSVIPHLQTAVIKGAGHMVVGDSNHLFNDALIGFLKKLRPNQIALSSSDN